VNGLDYYGDFVAPNDVNGMKLAVAAGPVAVSINANDPNFGKMGKGVYSGSSSCSGSSNHAVVVCGYGNDAATGKNYWMVKNSWGKDWGDNGYIKFEMGKNVCNIESQATYPLLDMTKKTDASSMCVNDKACNSDSDCNAVATSCRSGKCLCQPCVKNVVCQTDADCGNMPGACANGGDPTSVFVRQVSANKKYCDCRTGCIMQKSCSSDAGCGGLAGACRDTGSMTSSDGVNWSPVSQCNCDTSCKTGNQCTSDAQCGSKSGACKKTNSMTSSDGGKTWVPVSKCTC